MNSLHDKHDYVVVGSGIAGLVFAALMSETGKRVLVLEAHEHPGGYGHTFQLGRSARFNAQLHYVWNCGEGETVNKVLKRLALEQQVTFERLDPQGFDHMYMPGYSLKIPSSSVELTRRLARLFPDHKENIARFISCVNRVASGLDLMSSRLSVSNIVKQGLDVLNTIPYFSSSLQQVFDRHQLPQAAQTLLASQWPDFLLPPEKLSFYAWVMLFTGYQRGAYYPTRHFEHVIDSLVARIRHNGSQVRLQQEVTGFKLTEGRIRGLEVHDLACGKSTKISAGSVICNMDPQRAARMIGMEQFAPAIRKKLSYDYSPSNFMVYCSLEGIDLAQHGFGKWNVFHTGHQNLNEAFRAMYEEHDYSNPSFAITTPGFMTADSSDRPPGQSIVEILTVADYNYFETMLTADKSRYRKEKKAIVNAMFDVIEQQYIPNFRKHLAFSTAGTPTTNERFCRSPAGNSYGSNMTPANIGLNRLGSNSSVSGLYFCNASSGFAGFAGTFWTGATLYEELSGDRVL